MNVAVNGLGRIGRAIFKMLQDEKDISIKAANDLVPADNLAYLLKYDTVYGRYEREVDHDQNSLTV